MSALLISGGNSVVICKLGQSLFIHHWQSVVIVFSCGYKNIFWMGLPAKFQEDLKMSILVWRQRFYHLFYLLLKNRDVKNSIISRFEEDHKLPYLFKMEIAFQKRLKIWRFPTTLWGNWRPHCVQGAPWIEHMPFRLLKRVVHRAKYCECCENNTDMTKTVGKTCQLNGPIPMQ